MQLMKQDSRNAAHNFLQFFGSLECIRTMACGCLCQPNAATEAGQPVHHAAHGPSQYWARLITYVPSHAAVFASLMRLMKQDSCNAAHSPSQFFGLLE